MQKVKIVWSGLGGELDSVVVENREERSISEALISMVNKAAYISVGDTFSFEEVQEKKAASSVVVEFDDNEFQRSHGKAPKGTGSWAFEFLSCAVDIGAMRTAMSDAASAVGVDYDPDCTRVEEFKDRKGRTNFRVWVLRSTFATGRRVVRRAVKTVFSSIADSTPGVLVSVAP